MVCLHGFPIMTYHGLVQLHWHCKPGRNGTLRVTCQTDYLPRQERKVRFGQLPLKMTPVTSNHPVPQLTKQTCCVITSSTFNFLKFFISSPSTSTHWYTTSWSLISQLATKTVKQNTTSWSLTGQLATKTVKQNTTSWSLMGQLATKTVKQNTISWSLMGQLATKTVKQNTTSWSLMGQLATKTVKWTAVHASFSLFFNYQKQQHILWKHWDVLSVLPSLSAKTPSTASFNGRLQAPGAGMPDLSPLQEWPHRHHWPTPLSQNCVVNVLYSRVALRSQLLQRFSIEVLERVLHAMVQWRQGCLDKGDNNLSIPQLRQAKQQSLLPPMKKEPKQYGYHLLTL